MLSEKMSDEEYEKVISDIIRKRAEHKRRKAEEEERRRINKMYPDLEAELAKDVSDAIDNHIMEELFALGKEAKAKEKD